MFNNFFFSENCTVCEIIPKSMVDIEGPHDVTIWRIRV